MVATLRLWPKKALFARRSSFPVSAWSCSMTSTSFLPFVCSSSSSWRMRATTMGMVGTFLRAMTSARSCRTACSSIRLPLLPAQGHDRERLVAHHPER
jgi:hypothetical protein